jgi:di/tricarboxylate transporter
MSQSLVVLLGIVCLFILLVKTKIHPSLLFASLLFMFFLLNYINVENMLENFVNPSLVSLILLLVLAYGINKTFLNDYLSGLIIKNKSLSKTIFRLGFLAGGLSAFINNTAVVASFLSPIKSNRRFPPSKLLIPLSYSAILGGTVTLIGTSTNLIVNSFVIKEGLPPLRVFDFVYVGLPLFLVGISYLSLGAHRLLPAIKEKKPKPSRFFLEAKVLPGSRHTGKTVQENNFRNLESLFLAEIIRRGKLISPVTPDEIIQEGDILVFVGEVNKIKDIEKFDRIQVFEEENWKILEKNLVEVILSHNSTLIGKSIKEVNFRARFDAVAVAVKRGEQKLSGKIGSIKLQPGDSLVLAVGADFGKKEDLSSHFYFVNPLPVAKKLSFQESLLAIGFFLVAIILSAAGVVSLVKSLMIVLFLYFILGFLSLEEIKDNLHLELVLLIGSAIGVAEVMINSGAAQTIASLILSIFNSFGPWGNLVGVFLLTQIMTLFITNNATAALSFPIAYATALSLGVNPLPFIMAIAYGSSSNFLTPYSYQTNLIIYGPGNYRFHHFLKIGLPLALLYGLIVCGLVPLFFHF